MNAAQERLAAITQALRSRYGPEYRRVAAVACGLAAAPAHSLGDLIRTHGVSHRTLIDLLAQLAPFVEVCGRQITVHPEHQAALRAAFAPDALAHDPFERLVPMADAAPLVAAMRALVARAPKGDADLDHVSADAATCVRRARLLCELVDVAGSSLLFLGDHDLTSLALLLVSARPPGELYVVDVDERILAFIDTVAQERGWAVRTRFADFRLGVPADLAGRFDLVFCDPPYTEAGVALFAGRAVECLARKPFSRLLLCYGFGEQLPALGCNVQAELQRRRIAIEAVIPGFNHYDGAEAIGCRSALYICRPTPKSWAIKASADQPEEPRIYTHGASAVEAAGSEAAGEVMEALQQELAAGQVTKLVAVGFADDGSGLPQATRRLGLARFVTEQLDVKRKPGRAPDTLVISLQPHYSHLFPRILLLCDQPRVYVIATRRNPFEAGRGALWQLAAARFYITPIGSGGLYRAVARSPEAGDRVEQTLRRWAARRKSQLRNGLVKALSGPAGGSLTQNQARSLLDGRSAVRRYGSARLWDVPEHGLAALIDDVTAICRGSLPLTDDERPRF